ncbi:sensor histidine kinase [Aquimarina rhabdastrellae]
MEYLLKAEEISKEYPEYKKELNRFIYSNLSSMYAKTGSINKGLYYRLKILKDTIYVKSHLERAKIYNKLGAYHHKLEESIDQKQLDGIDKEDSSYYYHHKCLKYALKYNVKAYKRMAYSNLGNYFRVRKNRDSTVYYYKKARKEYIENPKEGDRVSRKWTEKHNALILFYEGKINESITILRRIVNDSYIKKRNSEVVYDLKIEVCRDLVMNYKAIKEYDKAIEVLEKMNKYTASYYKDVLKEQMQELDIAYKTKEKEASIQKLEQKSQEQEAVIRERTIITLALGGGLVLLLGIGILFFRQRKLQTKYETANLEQRLLRSQLNPHFIFNALNTVSGLAHQKSEQTVPYIVKLGNLIRLVLKNSREEFVSVADEVRAVEDYLELQSNFSQKFQYQLAIQETIDTEEVLVPPMFVQPFVENAINHGIINKEDGKIHVDMILDQKQKLLTCTIEDNGEGFKGKKEKQFIEKEASYSGDILKDRLKIYAKSMHKKARYTIEEKEEGGIKVTVYLPYILDV